MDKQEQKWIIYNFIAEERGLLDVNQKRRNKRNLLDLIKDIPFTAIDMSLQDLLILAQDINNNKNMTDDEILLYLSTSPYN